MKAKLTEEEFINWWLEKYHNTNIEKLLEENPSWKANPREHTYEFYKKYAVTQEQHDCWHKWAIDRVMKHYRLSRKRAEREFCWAYLNTAPSIKEKGVK